MKNEYKPALPVPSLFAPSTEDLAQATLYAGDIHQPWKSVNGFAVAAARLAAFQKLRLHCREDEVFELIAMLNNLLEHPATLNRAFEGLELFEQEHRQKLTRLVAAKEEQVSGNKVGPLLDDVARFNSGVAQLTVASPLKETCGYDPAAKIPDLLEVLDRLQKWLAALEKVKHSGFHVIVYDRHRQPDRPALEARRNEPIWQDGQSFSLPAGFLLPAKHHLTLWAYLVTRSDQGQATVWN